VDIHRINAAAEAIKRRCRQDFPKSFTGLKLDRSNGRIIVFRGDDVSVDEAITAAFPDLDIAFRRGGHSRQVLEAIRARVEQDRDYWRQRGVEIAVLGVVADGGVEIGTPQADTAGHVIEERYGPDYVFVMKSSPVLLPPFRGPVPGISRDDPYGRRRGGGAS
jgi:hypothetical protein